jgi:hypothetical protein
MSAADYLAAAALLLAAGGIVFNAGRIREAQIQAKKDADGIGKKQREMEAEFRDKYLRTIAASIEAAQTEEARKVFTKLLREDR